MKTDAILVYTEREEGRVRIPGVRLASNREQILYRSQMDGTR